MPDRWVVYWDADVFLHYIEGTPQYIGVLDALLKSASDGDIEIVTSIISIGEVAYDTAEMKAQALDADIETKLDALWDDRSVINLINVSHFVMYEARQMIRQAVADGKELYVNDAIHLASAKRVNAAEFHTYRGDLNIFNPYIPFSVKLPSTDRPMLPFPPI